MAGKTLIGGTAYEISGGKTRVNGTAYAIAGGKTLVGGTAYDISFGVDLAELFRGMTVLRTDGRNSGSTGRITIEPVSTYLNTGETGYIFSFFNGYMSIAKIVCGTAGTQAIYQSSESYGNCWYALSYDAIWYCDIMNNGYNSKYGATLALVKFDQPEAKVDAVLSKLQYATKTGRNSPSQAAVYLGQTALSEGDIVFAARRNYFGISRVISQPSGNALYAPETLFSYTSSLSSDWPLVEVDTNSGRWYLDTIGTVVQGGTIHVVKYIEQ